MTKEKSPQKWQKVQQIIEDECKKEDENWIKRRRVLDTKLILLIILKISTNERSQGLRNVLDDFWNKCEAARIKLESEKAIAASSFCEARQKVSEEVIQKINKRLDDLIEKDLWHGMRVLAVDGSRLNLPRELINADYPLYRSQVRHYPQGLLSCLYDVINKVVVDFELVSHMNERRCLENHLSSIEGPALVMFDRGYFSYCLLHQCVKKGVDALFRLPIAGVNKEIEKFINSSETDQMIEYIPSTTVLHDLKKQGVFLQKEEIPIRLIKFYIKNEKYVFCTTLQDSEKYSVEDFKMIYNERWKIEELYKISKVFLEAESFHSKTERGVKQEVYANILMINIARYIECIANKELPLMSKRDLQKFKEENIYKMFNKRSMFNINFKHCIFSITNFLEKLILDVSHIFDNFFFRLVKQITRVRQKIRPKRSYERVSHKVYRKWTYK